VLWVFLLSLSFLSLGCSDDLVLIPCTPPGEAVACTCADGSASLAECSATGILGFCDCIATTDTGGADGGGSDTPIGDARVDASSDGGTEDTGGDDTGGDDTGGDDTGGDDTGGDDTGGGDTGGDDATESVDPFVGEFNCIWTAITAGAPNPAVDDIVIEGTDLGDGTVRWLSPGTRENLFQGCPTLHEVAGDTATLVGGEECESSVQSGSAVARSDGTFVGNYSGGFSGLSVTIAIDCAPFDTSGDDFVDGFEGEWSCEGETVFNGQTLATSFGIVLERFEREYLRLQPTSGDSIALALCSSLLWTPTSASFAELRDDSVCDVGGDTPPTSTGLTLAGGTLSGDVGFGSDGGPSASTTFSCVRE
jgi:hypothetical protein